MPVLSVAKVATAMLWKINVLADGTIIYQMIDVETEPFSLLDKSLPDQNHDDHEEATLEKRVLWEKNECMRYRIGARYYDADLAMWTSVDAMRQFWSGYSYGDPVNSFDPDGNEKYYTANGQQLYGPELNPADNNVYLGYDRQAVITSDLNLFNVYSATVYAEGTNNLQELSGIASVIQSRADYTGRSTLDIITHTGIDGYGSPKYNRILNHNGNDNAYYNNARAAVINAMTGGVDYSNGSYFWAATASMSRSSFYFNMTTGKAKTPVFSEVTALGGTTFLNYNHDNPRFRNNVYP